MIRKKTASAIICGIAASFIITAGSITAFAKEERTKIKKVELNITSMIRSGQGSDVRISGGSGYTVDGYEVVNMPEDKWSGYDCPRIAITLMADEDYYFSSNGSGYFSLKGDADKFVSAERGDEGSSMYVTVDLKPITAKIGNPTDLSWSSNGVAKWIKGYKAKKYEVALYRDDTWVKKETTTATSYNFAADMTGDYEYYFKVRSSDGDNIYSNWVESATFSGTVKTSDTANTSDTGNTNQSIPQPGIGPGKWVVSADGWWYQNPDDSYPMNSWKCIDSSWYYFNGDGYMLTGLQTVEGRLFYLKEGDTQTGVMQTGWVQLGDKWYYFGTDGAALINTTTPDGYQVGPDGTMVQ